jgi:murein DD-endopeptidase MepM/ murein hydrolase activator NlpD
MAPSEFTFNSPGHLQPSTGDGDADSTIYAPGIRFPIETPNAFANSQVYGHGGEHGAAGSQCDSANYVYPWSDNFCEKRDRTTPLCPSGKGHQGQDIRPNSCVRGKYIAVAAESGTITQIGSYTVSLIGDSGRTFRYLHLDMNNLKVRLGDTVTRGQPIGYVSNDFGGTTTTIHLHFEIRESVTDGTTTMTTFVPPYSSLVDAYQRLLAGEE